jgi:malate synthase
MAAFIPNRRDPEVTERAVARVREDKLREAGDGFDGTWVAHPTSCRSRWRCSRRARRPPQPEGAPARGRARRRAEQQLADLHVPGGTVTDAGVRLNVNVALQYLEAWLRGSGAVAIHNLMEDAATAEISRAQLWQWVSRGVTTAEGTRVDAELYRRVRAEELDALLAERGATPHRLHDAAALLDRLVLSERFDEFLTLLLDAPTARAACLGSPDPEKPHGDALRARTPAAGRTVRTARRTGAPLPPGATTRGARRRRPRR